MGPCNPLDQVHKPFFPISSMEFLFADQHHAHCSLYSLMHLGAAVKDLQILVKQWHVINTMLILSLEQTVSHPAWPLRPTTLVG